MKPIDLHRIYTTMGSATMVEAYDLDGATFLGMYIPESLKEMREEIFRSVRAVSFPLIEAHAWESAQLNGFLWK